MCECITMIKYQGLGNDYLVLDPNKNRVQLQGKKIALMCQRGFGLGADGVLYGPVEINGKMGVRIFNSDGSESAISGNGVRIFAKYLMDYGYVKEQQRKFPGQPMYRLHCLLLWQWSFPPHLQYQGLLLRLHVLHEEQQENLLFLQTD